MKNSISLSHLKNDLPAGIVVFLVALPLCLGVALASGAPLFAGVIAGVMGGIIVGLFSGSQLGVSGPAAGLTVIVYNAIQSIGVYEAFLLSVVFAGVFQILFSLIGAGKIAYFFPLSVIKGMLTAIGIIIILKQLPHAFGLDKDFEGDFGFFQPDGENTFSELIRVKDLFETGALVIGLVSLLILNVWDSLSKKVSFLAQIPGPLICVISGIVINAAFGEGLKLQSEHLVSLPIANSPAEFFSFLRFPDFTAVSNVMVWKTAFVIAIIASLETLLCVEATDKLDPEGRLTPTNRELFAQGFGNMVSGFIGGLPLTQVIVRSSANLQSGGKTKVSTIFHGLLLLICAIFIPQIINMIPLSSLAAILIMVGYKLAKPSIFVESYKEGLNQFIPFVITVIAIVFTDLLTGILIGLCIGICYVLYTNFRSAVLYQTEGNSKLIIFNKDIFFFNRAEIANVLRRIEDGDNVYVDATKANFIDYDVYVTLNEFAKEAKLRGINLDLKGITLRKTKQK